jgi:hypothetical protein
MLNLLESFLEGQEGVEMREYRIPGTGGIGGKAGQLKGSRLAADRVTLNFI